MKILLVFRFFHHIWFIDSENLFLISKEKNDKVSTFNIVYFLKFEISPSVISATL